MPPPKLLIRFFFLAALFFAVLMAPWPGLQRGYAAVFRTGGDVLFSRTFWFWTQGRVRFLDLDAQDLVGQVNAVIPGQLPPGVQPPPATGVKDTLMVLMNTATPASTGQLRTSSRYIAYVPMAMVVALILATPLPGSRRFRALVWGLVGIHAFVAIRLSLTLSAKGFAAEKIYALFQPGPSMSGMLTRLETLLSDDPTVSFVVPVFLWFVLAMRPWQHALVQGKEQNDTPAAPTRKA